LQVYLVVAVQYLCISLNSLFHIYNRLEGICFNPNYFAFRLTILLIKIFTSSTMRDQKAISSFLISSLLSQYFNTINLESLLILSNQAMSSFWCPDWAKEVENCIALWINSIPNQQHRRIDGQCILLYNLYLWEGYFAQHNISMYLTLKSQV